MVAVPGDALQAEARALALTMTQHDPMVLAAAKRSLREGALLSLPEAMKNEQQRTAELRSQRAGRQG